MHAPIDLHHDVLVDPDELYDDPGISDLDVEYALPHGEHPDFPWLIVPSAN